MGIDRQMGQMDALWLSVSCRHEPAELAVMQEPRPFVPSSEHRVCEGDVGPGDRTGQGQQSPQQPLPSQCTHRDPPGPGVGQLLSNPRPHLVPASNPLLGPALLANHSRPHPATPTPRGNPELRGGEGGNHRINPALLRAALRSAGWIRRPRASPHPLTSSRQHLSSSPQSNGETEARPQPPGPHNLRFAPRASPDAHAWRAAL